ncbi:hydroxysqualene dehydroxylase HpnE [Rhodoferax sp. U11-2br]|uniref:hydroxysqualene dehydroxylase HpnE n=1 Tax=Rhodoferax sp. U11-2br TaxID=2838878 RepID=UPI00352E7A81
MAAGLNIAVVGAGWAGLAAAVTATQAGHTTTVFEAAEALGGRARAIKAALPDGTQVVLDNGQHILIGAYSDTLALMRQVGVAPEQTLLDLPMRLPFPDGLGIRFPNWPTPLDALGGILGARGWSLGDKWSLLRTAAGWQRQGFVCDDSLSVAALCHSLTPRILAELIEPLCVSALNTPADQASGRVFLRVLRDALFGEVGGSHLLLPTTDLGALLPQAAADWLQQRGGQVLCKARVEGLQRSDTQWQLAGSGLGPAAEKGFDAVIWATSASNAAQALMKFGLDAPENISNAVQSWAQTAQALQFEAIATVYAWSANARLSQPMLALRSNAAQPAQFAFDRASLGSPRGLLAFVVSAAQADRATLQAQVLAQAKAQLGLDLLPVLTVVEKRATFACTPGLQRPAQHIAPGLLACGDYVEGPYPATLEGAVRSGIAAIQTLTLGAVGA